MCGRPADPGLSQVRLKGLGGLGHAEGLQQPSHPQLDLPPDFPDGAGAPAVGSGQGGLDSCVPGEAGQESSRGPRVSAPPAPLPQVPDQH